MKKIFLFTLLGAFAFGACHNAQDAHEAIRPINMNMTPEKVKSSLSPDNYKLYKLIYERFLASQMSEAIYSNVTANLNCEGYDFKAVGKTQEFAGYTAAYREYEGDEKQEISKLPPLNEGELLDGKEIKAEQKFTKPPARYTEASLVKAMEEKGIGRPATYAATIMVLSSREYVSKEGKQLVPTELGRKVVEYLEKFFSSVINVKFTAHMEQRLDDVANKGEDWHEVVESFWNGFSKLLSASDSSGFSLKPEPIETDIICEKCGHRADIFGHEGAKKTAEQMGETFLGEIPLHYAIRENSDNGTPIVFAEPDSSYTQAYMNIAEKILQKL